MSLNKRTLKGLIEYSDLRNTEGTYSEDDVAGVSTDKRMIPTKANLDGVNLKEYKLFPPGYFAFVADTSRRGDKIALAYNDTERTYIVSTWYVVFSVKEDKRDLIIPDYLFLFLNRTEFDRYARSNSWGSAREYFWFSDMEDVQITLPSIDTQQRFVDIYKAMVANQQSYEQGLDDLKLVADVMIEKYKYATKRMPLGELLQENDVRNTMNSVAEVDGVNKDKQFMPSVASGYDLSKYKLVERGSFACNLMHIGRDVVVPIALNTKDDFRLVSPAYMVLKTNSSTVLPEYVLMWMSRAETDRRAWFMSDSSVRSGMEKRRFFEITVPVPPIEEQKVLVEIHKVLNQRKTINELLKSQIKDICPVLIRGSLEYGG